MKALHLAEIVRQKAYPNRWGARVPLEYEWNLQLLQALLAEYKEREIVD